MPQFSERIECLVFRKSFNETLFNIDQQLDLVEQAAQTLRNRCVHVTRLAQQAAQTLRNRCVHFMRLVEQVRSRHDRCGHHTHHWYQQLECRNWVRRFCTHIVFV